ncbi:hypothetical protein LTR09_003335 [Extremus antarcticus]|uniref:Uncharacterized protein n=1 Tax=Extremus antarcticus TaxID=702011 RepID=A0AAJ0LUX6_9PEZI|nr:hypothetical protein LTR09_003335 [Extremus antarcticus]
MKDPGYTEAWVDALVLRLLHDQVTSPGNSSQRSSDSEIETDLLDVQSELSHSDLSRQSSTLSCLPPKLVINPALLQRYSSTEQPEAQSTMTTCKVIRSSPASVATLRNLRKTANVVLFTPVIVPAGDTPAFNANHSTDPFEPLGRALSSHHKRIRHVPYVPQVGFTETHSTFLNQADAVVTVVCEPDRSKHGNVSNQMDFAEAALDAFQSNDDTASNVFTLVQVGSDEFRLPADANFENVIEVDGFVRTTARQVAQAVFRKKSPPAARDFE